MNQIRIVTIILFATLLNIDHCYSQNKYSMKAEAGLSMFQGNTLQVDPGPNWKGHNLSGENGVSLNLINGFHFNHKTFVGAGVGYLNFEGINGISLFSDFEHLFLKTKLTPLVNLKVGYCHIWNQYENGTGTGLGELCFGLNYILNKKIHIYGKSGFIMTQQSILYPIIVGIRI